MVPGACRINLMRGLIRPSTTPVIPVKAKPPDTELLLPEVAVFFWIGAPTNVGAWTSPRTFTHDPQLLIAKELGTEWLPRWCCVEYDFPCALQICQIFPRVRINQGGISSMAHDMHVCKWVFNVSHATRTHCRIGKMIGS